MWRGDSLTRGGLTLRLGAGVKPAFSNSLTPYGKGADVSFILAALDSTARLTTNCLVARTLRSVSLTRPWRSLTGAKQTLIGWAVMPVKNEYGARFVVP